MAYFDYDRRTEPPLSNDCFTPVVNQPRPSVLVIEDGYSITLPMQTICDFLDLDLETVSSYEDLGPILAERQPMAVIAEADCEGQDGCHVLMTVAAYDPSTPILLLTGEDPTVLGAVEAVQELWQLQTVIASSSLPSVGKVVEFLFNAGLNARCARFMPV
ncbi:MAG: hypothetical protein JO227_17895 [Acetobacteraceae bacterium]|nr:hypothetical protein [Acetobacteraceae bacterium]